jgi:hypothetical protein
MVLVPVLAGVRTNRTCSVGLLLVLITLVPLAHASPPDPTWIAGIYDDGDYDDVVIAVAGMDLGPNVVIFTVGTPDKIVVGGFIQTISKVLQRSVRASRPRGPPPTYVGA